MVIRDKVKQEIDRMPEGVVVSASDFDIPRQYRATLIKALNQFEYAGIITTNPGHPDSGSCFPRKRKS